MIGAPSETKWTLQLWLLLTLFSILVLERIGSPRKLSIWFTRSDRLDWLAKRGANSATDAEPALASDQMLFPTFAYCVQLDLWSLVLPSSVQMAQWLQKLRETSPVELLNRPLAVQSSDLSPSSCSWSVHWLLSTFRIWREEGFETSEEWKAPGVRELPELKNAGPFVQTGSSGLLLSTSLSGVLVTFRMIDFGDILPPFPRVVQMHLGVEWVIGARGGLQFCRPQKSWDAWCLPYHSPFCRPILIAPGAIRRFRPHALATLLHLPQITHRCNHDTHTRSAVALIAETVDMNLQHHTHTWPVFIIGHIAAA